MEFSRPEPWSGWPFPPPGDLPNPGTEPRSPALQVDALPAQPQGKPKNIEVGFLSLLQRIFQTQELNQGLLNCRWILYQLSDQGSYREVCVEDEGEWKLVEMGDSLKGCCSKAGLSRDRRWRRGRKPGGARAQEWGGP